MSMNPWFRGADNALARLGIHGGNVGNVGNNVGGMDYVGAARANLRAAMAAQMSPASFPGQYNPPPGAFSNSRLADLQQISLAGAVPQILLGIGDPLVKVKAGATISFSPEGSVPLRPTKFTVANSIAPFFVINQITVARLNLLAGSIGVPAEGFIAQADTPPLEFPIVAAGSQVIVQVTNIDGADHIFSAMLSAIDLTTAQQRMNP